MEPTAIELTASILFVAAVVHTFLVSKFQNIAHRFPEGSVAENFFHFLGEIEVVFGLWAGLFILSYTFFSGFIVTDSDGVLVGGAVKYLNDLNYTEAMFVFVIMTMSATKPILILTERLIYGISTRIPFNRRLSFYFCILTIGSLLGSLITEPAAMTVCALLLRTHFFKDGMSDKLRYATIALLFVNISIGGTLTNFAAPPVLMVAAKWGWDTAYMASHFGYKAIAAVILTTAGTCIAFWGELQDGSAIKTDDATSRPIPAWITLIHVISLAAVIYTAHYPVFFMGFFLFFLGFMTVAKEYQTTLDLRGPLLVGFFLAGLVTLGTPQGWWIKQMLTGMGEVQLFVGTTILTAFTDNAALTYLGSLIELSPTAKQLLVAGAVTGGGLTVIANAPNPAGFGILNDSFGPDGIRPLRLAAFALPPTLVAAACFYFLPSLS